MPARQKDDNSKRDWRISATLGAVWVVALTIVHKGGVDIPASMLLVATVFFVLLIPAMNDLVCSIERLSVGRGGAPRQNPGANDE